MPQFLSVTYGTPQKTEQNEAHGKTQQNIVSVTYKSQDSQTSIDTRNRYIQRPAFGNNIRFCEIAWTVEHGLKIFEKCCTEYVRSDANAELYNQFRYVETKYFPSSTSEFDLKLLNAIEIGGIVFSRISISESVEFTRYGEKAVEISPEYGVPDVVRSYKKYSVY